MSGWWFFGIWAVTAVGFIAVVTGIYWTIELFGEVGMLILIGICIGFVVAWAAVLAEEAP